METAFSVSNLFKYLTENEVLLESLKGNWFATKTPEQSVFYADKQLKMNKIKYILICETVVAAETPVM